jgi:hypothetical protein
MIFGKGNHGIPRNARNMPMFEIHSIRPCSRVGPDGQQRIDLVAEVVQRRAGYLDPEIQAEVDAGPANQGARSNGKTNPAGYWAFTPSQHQGGKRPMVPQPPDFWFRGGCTLIIDPETGEIRYCIRKSIQTEGDARLERQRQFEQAGANPSIADTYFGLRGRNPFALLHTEL